MAFGTKTVDYASGAVGDIFKGFGAAAEAENYDAASALAFRNVEYSKKSFAVKDQMADRSIYKAVEGQQADVSGAGFAASGSALDLLRDSQREGALTKELLTIQGTMEQDSYNEQGKAYHNMAEAARMAETGFYVSAALKGVAAITSLYV